MESHVYLSNIKHYFGDELSMENDNGKVKRHPKNGVWKWIWSQSLCEFSINVVGGTSEIKAIISRK